MGGSTKLMSSGAGGVILTTPGSIAADVTVNLPTAGVNGGTLVCSDSSGNVGIGTSSPSSRLEATANSCVRWTLTDASWVNAYATNPAKNAYVGLATDADSHVWKTGGSERMRIDSSGNLLVGTTAQPVLGNERFGVLSSSGCFGFKTTGSTVGGMWGLSGSSAGSGNYCNFYNGSGGTQVGSISFTASATAFNTSSDYRLKENIQPMQNALGVVQQLNPVTYTWKADGSDGQGFIAHELQAVVPDCVTGEKDAVDAEGKPVYQGIDTSFLVATLTKAIQEQQAQIETLTAKVAALEAK